MIKRIIWLITIAALCLGGWGYYKRLGSKAKPDATVRKKVSGEDADLEQKITGFTIDGRSPKGVKQWHLEGNYAEIIDEVIHLRDLAAVAYGENTTVNLTSDTGIYSKDKGEVELMGNVKVVADDGSVLTTDRARWSQATKEIFTETVIHIERKGMKAEGTGGMANADAKKAMLRKNVTVILEPSTKVCSDGALEISYDDNRAIFHDNVRVEDKDGKLFADKLTVELDPDSKRIAQVIAEGNVTVRRGKSYTISEKAVYSDTTKSAKLSGRPRVIIDPEQIAELDEGFGMPAVSVGK